jgi:hypothetical protein
MATSFTLTVPHNAAGVAPVSRASLRLTLASDAVVSLTITDPGANAHLFNPSVPAVGASPISQVFDYPPVVFPAPLGARSDTVLVRREGGASANDPVRRTCVVEMVLNTDFDPAVCGSTNPGTTENWQFSVTAGPEISGICTISFTPDPLSGCTGALVLPIGTPASQLANVGGKADQSCGLARSGNPARVEMVLDRSGSMSAASTLSGTPATTRMQALHQAVQNFIGVWDSLDVTNDNTGVVTFDSLPPEEPFGAGLQPFPSVSGTILGGISSVTPRAGTSLGAGMIKGGNALAAGSGRKIMLVMSDGQQNTDPMVGVNLMTNQVFTTTGGGAPVTLPNLGAYQIYNVTIGPDAAVEPAIKYHMAAVTGGYYINTETNGALLTPFFLDLLGNFVHFNSWETARLIHGEVSIDNREYQTELYLSTATQAVAVNLSWDIRLGRLVLRVEAAAGEIPYDIFHDYERGAARVTFDPGKELSSRKPFILRVFLEDLGGLGKELGGVIPFELVALVEDAAVNADLLVPSRDYKAGDAIDLEVRLREFGLPIGGVGGNAGDQLLVQVVPPGQSVGDLLSKSSAPANQPPTDPLSPAQSKLFNIVQNDLDAFRRDESNPDQIVLTEESPGIYRGSYKAGATGHYNFVFGVVAGGPETSMFMRQAIRTVYVRSVPDASTTAVNVTISGGQLGITFTPRTSFGDLLGPGWANHFWFTTPGGSPFKGRDNLDGSYSASLGFSGSTPPAVSLHFVDVLQVIGDETSAERLPVKLGQGTILIERLPKTGIGGGGRGDDDTLQGCLLLFIRLLIAIGRLSVRALERLLKQLGG